MKFSRSDVDLLSCRHIANGFTTPNNYNLGTKFYGRGTYGDKLSNVTDDHFITNTFKKSLARKRFIYGPIREVDYHTSRSFNEQLNRIDGIRPRYKKHKK